MFHYKFQQLNIFTKRKHLYYIFTKQTNIRIISEDIIQFINNTSVEITTSFLLIILTNSTVQIKPSILLVSTMSVLD